MNRPLLRSMITLVCSGLLSAMGRADTFTVLDVSFARTQIDVQQITESKLVGRTPQGPMELPLRDLVMLDRNQTKPSGDPQRFLLTLRSGECISGTPSGFANDAVQWTHPILRERSVPLAQIKRISRANAQESPLFTPEESTRDVLLLSNGDRASGIIISMDEKAVTLQGSDGQPATVEWSSIRQIHLAETGEAVAPSTGWRLSLADGSVIDVDALSLRDQSFRTVRGGVEAAFPLDAVRTVENRSGRARLLPNLPRLRSEYAPYFPRVGSENSIAVPPEVSIGNTRTRVFIAARPYSRLTWNLEGSPTRFKTRFVMAPASPLANCEIRIWLDDKMVMDRADLTSNTPPEAFETPIGQAQTITLEVDFGDNFDVQDQLYWVEPALIWDEAK